MSEEDFGSDDIGSSRARRRNVKRVDYSKEQEFSDDDLFEDSPVEEAPKTRRGRKSKGGGGTGIRTAVVTTATTQDAENEDDLYENRPIYTEKGYDPALPPIRERFPFLPEYEEDGSPKIELIVGRRAVDEKEDVAEETKEEDEDEEDDAGPSSRRRSAKKIKEANKKKKDSANENETVEYEYLVKYRGRSYLHLEWKTGADLESMNKSAKGIYRRYLKKVLAGVEEDLENPDFDPSYVVPEKILDEADQEITVELTDKELLRWEKQREKELEEEEDDDEEDEEKEETGDKTETKSGGSFAENGEKKSAAGDEAGKSEENNGKQASQEEEKKENSLEENEDWSDDELDFSKLTLSKLRTIVNREGSYYPVIEGSNNPYRDGYVTEPPKKPRASYLFFQCTMRSYFQKKYPNARQSELMTILGDKWGTLTEEEKEPFLQLAREESKQYEKEKVLLTKAQRANEVWQPLRRCMMVLNRLTSDSFSEIFLEPVNLEDFPDYEEAIDFPMDLGEVRSKLETKKYQAPEQFARDMRRVWNNCKIYNQHGSAIWHVADYMSKQFERLYHAWVLEFRERYLRWADPRARPWEHTCRMHDGKCNTPDDQMVLCDHCDAMYGIKCLQPPLKKIPSKAWHCRDCKPKLKSVRGIRMLSAVAENAARKRAELGDLPKKKVKQVMYLVKWKGLGYEFCTWETKSDINDDALVAEYHRINDSYHDDSELPAEIVRKALENAEHLKEEDAGGVASIPNLRAQLYAQTRAFEFAKFGMNLPKMLCSECGPKTTSVETTPLEDPFASSSEAVSKKYPREVVDCVADMIFKVSRKEQISKIRNNTLLPPPMTGEYDAIVPITSKGLMMNVGEIHGSVAFLGYRRFPDGSMGPSEIANLIRNVGDKIVAVDGLSTIGKSFKEVILMLRESGKNKFAFMRFLENRFSVCESDLASVGSKGRYAIEVLQKKFASDRQRIVVHRSQHLLDEEQPEEEEEKDDSTAQKDSDEESEDDGSEGEFQPDSEDEELAEQPSQDSESPREAKGLPAEEDKPTDSISSKPAPDSEKAAEQAKPPSAEKETGQSKPPAAEEAEKEGPRSGEDQPKDTQYASGILSQHETTQSLAYRLLDVDVGYSSDEGGDEDCAYFVDGLDNTFARADEYVDLKTGESSKKANEEASVPAKQSEFSTLGDRAKLTAAVALSVFPPDTNEFDNFPNPSTAKLAAMEATKENAQAEPSSPTKQTKRSTVKVEQISVSTGELLHVWANVESAAATLQLPLPALRQVLKGEYDEDIGDEVGGFKWRYALAGAKVTAGAGSSSRGGGGKKAKEAWLEFRDKLYDPNEPHIYKNGNRLRDYQVDGVNWLSSTWYKRQGCILADEMGLGKTVQIVCYIEHLFRVEKIRRPYLVVVPLSTIEHWRREFEGWTDIICCIYHDRQRIWRDVLREYEWYFEDKLHTPEFLKFDVLVTTYDTLIGDFDVISQIPFRVAVVDEAHRLRNQKGKLLECMREISAKGTMAYGFQSRVLMSGTPLQNDLTELWTLLNFIEPFKFPDLDNFLLNFGNMANREQVERLQNMISPFMLRRVKEDVAKDIPAKEETVIDVELTGIQKQYYRAIFEHNHAFLNMGATRQNAPKLMNIQMELRKVCNHPFLLEGVEHREIDRLFKEFSEKGAFQGKTAEEKQRMINEQGYVFSSGKMVLLDKLLPKLRQEGHKILIFSQMVKMLDLISEYCEYRNFRYERLDGRVRGTERQKAIDRFEREEDSFLFLLSTRAGGVGINLTAADIVVIFDSDWNPQNDIQAQARCHRIGQTKDVRIYRLVTSRSFEQEMFDRASKKLGLEQAVLGTFEKETDDDKPTQEEMEQLLKKGAYALLEDENDEITNQFCADDIESILAKRTRTRVVEGAKTASWLNKQGMVVSKSKFSAETGGDVLDLDDPLFWQKVMPDFVTPSLMMQKLNDLQDDIEGRVRGPGRGRKRGRGRPKKNAEALADEDAQVVTTDAELAPNEGSSDPDDDKPAENGEIPPAEDSQSSPAEPEDPAVDALLADETLEEMSEPEEEDEDEEEKKGKPAKVQLSRANVRKVQKFMNDLKSMMESIFEDEDDEEDLSNDEKAACQKLLLTISVKEKIFTEEQRHLARVFLKRIEGDRRRRCRTSERFTPGKQDEEGGNAIPDELMIVGKKRKKRKKRGESAADDEESGRSKRRRRTSDGSGVYVGEDGYLHHSDSEEDWSIVGDDIYGTGKGKDRISSKEAKRRRQWCSGDDGPAAAGRAWPVFPRHTVKQVLSMVLEEMIKYDKENGGVFSEPVSKDDFPEYYEQIKKPMDYSTMKHKLENGEYRSAQAMQKDFILILQNCREFNARNSDIVKEAYEQHLLRPKLLKDAATKHGLFLAEDGSVLEIVDDEKKKSPKKKRAKKKKGSEAASDEESGGEKANKKKKIKKTTKKGSDDEQQGSDGDVEESEQKPRIRIKVKGAKDDDADDVVEQAGKKGKKKNKRKRVQIADTVDDGADADADDTPAPKRRKKATDGSTKKRGKRVSTEGKPDKVEEPIDPMFDPAAQKREREQLDGTFQAARKNLTLNGQWKLPESIEDKFSDVATLCLAKMDRNDRYSVFAEEVSEEEAPGYAEVVKNPMDFGTMRKKVLKGSYGTGSAAAAALYEDFLLVFDNCDLYNSEDSEVTEEATRVLSLLPETYAYACATVSKKR